MILRRLLIALLPFVLACLPLSAATYWIAPGGNDGNAGSESAPWQNFWYAFDQLTAGDTLILKDGEYGAMYINGLHGNASAWITIRAQNEHQARVVSYDGLSVNGGYNNAVRVEYSSYLIFDGLYVKADKQSGNRGAGISAFQSHHITMINNFAEDSGGGGLGSHQSDYITIENNVVRGNASVDPNYTSGISLYQNRSFSGVDDGSYFRNVIRGNIVYDNTNGPGRIIGSQANTDGNGIIIDDFRNTQNGSPYGPYAHPTLIENNLVYNNGGRGIHLFHSDQILVRNNTCYLNGTDLSDQLGGPIFSARGELSDVESNDNTWVNNVAVASKQIHSHNEAIFLGNQTEVVRSTYYNNLAFEVTSPGDDAVNIGDPHSILLGFQNLHGVDPIFANPASADFSLSNGSPAIDVGTAAFYLHSLDYNGGPRWKGAAVDMGAIESTGTQASGPSIAVEGSGLIIAHDDMEPRLEDGSDFGRLTQGSSKTQRFVIANAGTSTLTLPSNPVSSDNSVFSISSQPGLLSLDPGAATAFEVRLDMGAAQSNEALISVASNDSSTSTFRFKVSGEKTVATAAYPDGISHLVPVERIELEDFDHGGSGVAYHDDDHFNQLSSTYRSGEFVDIENPSPGRHFIGWPAPGEWLNYSIENATAGDYKIRLYAAAWVGSSVINWDIDGAQVASIDLSYTASPSDFQTFESNTFSLSEGQHVLTLNFEGHAVSVDWIEFVPVGGSGGGGSPPPSGLIAYEGFDGATNTGSGWSGDWSGTSVPSYVADGLAPTNYTDVGGAASSGWIEATRQLSNPVSIGADPIYASFAVSMHSQVSNAWRGARLDFNAGEGAGSSNFEFNVGLGAVNDSNPMVVTIQDPPGYQSVADGDVALENQTYFFLVKLFNDAGTLKADVWVYDDGVAPTAEPTAADAAYFQQLSDAAGASILRNIGIGVFGCEGTVDEIRIATDFDSVMGQAPTTPTHTVTFVAGSNGSLIGSTTQIVDEGSSTSAVTADPDSGYTFDGWSGDVSSSVNPLTISNVTSDITVTANFTVAVNNPPVVSIVSPSDGSSASENGAVSFNATAGDSEDGDLSASISWSSDRDGDLGDGASVNTSTLSVGTHTIMASVTDSGGETSSDNITLSVNAAGGGGSLLVYEGFDGSLNSGTGWAGDWSGPGALTHHATGLQVSDYTNVGGSTQNNYVEATRDLSSPVIIGSNPIYAAFALDFTYQEAGEWSTTRVAFNRGLGNGDANFEFFIGLDGLTQNGNLELRAATLPDLASDHAPGTAGVLDQTYFFVLKMVNDAGTLRTDIWVYDNGQAPTSEPLPGDGHYFTQLTDEAGASELRNVGLYAYWSTSRVDEIRIADDFDQLMGQTASNAPPTVSLLTPSDGSSVAEGSNVELTATASDDEDGDLSAGLSWSSDRDGSLGDGASLSTTTLSVGTHVITASVTDSGGETAIDTITLTIQAADGGGAGILIAYEGFDGDINTGSGWNGDWAGLSVPTYVASGLAPANYTDVGGAASAVWIEASRELSSPTSIGVDPIYAGFAVSMHSQLSNAWRGTRLDFNVGEGVGGANFEFNIGLGALNDSNPMVVKMQDPPDYLSVADGDVALENQTYFFLVKLFNEAGTLKADIWVYDDGIAPTTEPGTGDAAYFQQMTDVAGASELRNIGIGVFGCIGTVDEIRIADDFDTLMHAGSAPASGFAAWAATHISSGDDTPTGDPDGDGVVNLLEYAFGLDPMVAARPEAGASVNGLPTIRQDGSELVLTYRVDTEKSDLTLTVEQSSDFSAASWSTNGITDQKIADDGLIEVREARLTLSTRSFLRLKVICL